ncbi:MAG: suppressor of fused domain protein [Acidobacteria bacterium]|nr:suppressor of fused domain protein [Acidobacteriota bacterium]
MLKKLFNRAKAAISGLPSDAGGNLAAITRFGESALGEVTQALHEIHSPDLHIDVLHFAPNSERDFHYLITSGMSDRAMTDSGVAIDEPFWELTIALPGHWQINAAAAKDAALWAPIRLLKELARYPSSAW